MIINDTTIEFIRQHEEDAIDKLLLSASRYPGIDMHFVAEQILARRLIREKLPSWHAERRLVYPSRLATEQCSSELTARYKQALLQGDILYDLTGGLGVDAFYFSDKFCQVGYIDINPLYCKTAIHNFRVMGCKNIHVTQGDACILSSTLQADAFYIDPARRSVGNKRLFALADCEPDILSLKSVLLKQARQVAVKISPMADIRETVQLLPETTAIHVISVKNECKELLFVLEREGRSEDLPVHTVNLSGKGEAQHHVFGIEEEKKCPPLLHGNIETYLYEPNSALLKAGGFKWVATHFGIGKLHPHSHLYTSGELLKDFPGRRFLVEEIFDFSGKLLKHLSARLPQAHISTRNFPLSVDEIRKKSRIREGGEHYLFATTILPSKPILILCRKTEQ